jgi:hypothetical protein
LDSIIIPATSSAYRTRHALDLLVQRCARVGKDGDLVATLTRVDARLHDTGFRRTAGQQKTLDAELVEQQVERSVIEPRIAPFEQHGLAGTRRDGPDHVAAAALERALDQPRCIVDPGAVSVVHVHDRRSLAAGFVQRGSQRRKPFAKRREQYLTVLVLEVVQDVDHEQHVTRHSRSLPCSARIEHCLDTGVCDPRYRRSLSSGSPTASISRNAEGER